LKIFEEKKKVIIGWRHICEMAAKKASENLRREVSEGIWDRRGIGKYRRISAA
jgi:hypothetical protein